MQSHRRLISILLGVIFFFLFLLLNPFHLAPQSVKIASVAILMITWWVSEALPMAVVSLLPLVLFPLMGIAKIDEAAAPFANPIIFLCLGGFMIATAIEKWNLHKRIALNIVRITGTSGNRIIMGFMIATGFLSMWLSNTTTTMMMLPIAMSVIKVMEDTHKDHVGSLENLSICLMLSIAYASNLCGISTIIGTPPSVAYVAFAERQYNYTFDFREWMTLCAPLAWTMVACLYIVLVKILYPNRIPASAATEAVIKLELHDLGKMTKPERNVLLVFIMTVVLWITRDLLNQPELQSWILSIVRGKTVINETFFKLDDTMIAVFSAILLFLIPAHETETGERTHIMEWKDTHHISWGLLLMLGGGISMAAQLEKAGLVHIFGEWVASFSSGGFLLVFLIALLSVFISELMSNTAQVLVFAPVVAGIAEVLHMNPLQLGMAMALGASCAGMMPMGTPPNAIVFASGRLKLKHMTVTGFIMNIVSSTLVALFCWYLLPLLVQSIR